jgi:hypothetical protein
VPGFAEKKSSEYLELATQNESRAYGTKNPEMKKTFLELASAYRDFAEYIDDPEQWRAKLIASANAKAQRRMTR